MAFIDQQKKERAARIRKILGKVFAAFLVLFSTSAFACFIGEESIQTVNFGAFMYSNAKDWEGLAQYLETQKLVHKTVEGITHAIGWLNPIMYPSYLTFLKASQGYLDSIAVTVQDHLADSQPQETTARASVSQEAPPNGDCAWELIHWTDKETGEPKSAWYCQQTDKWYWP
jgi:hypothetical protein